MIKREEFKELAESHIEFVANQTMLNSKLTNLFNEMGEYFQHKHEDGLKQKGFTSQLVQIAHQQAIISDRTIKNITFVVRSLLILFIVQALIVIDLYFKDELSVYISLFISSWKNLSEGLQLFFIGIPVSLILNIIAHFVIKYLTKGAKKQLPDKLED